VGLSGGGGRGIYSPRVCFRGLGSSCALIQSGRWPGQPERRSSIPEEVVQKHYRVSVTIVVVHVIVQPDSFQGQDVTLLISLNEIYSGTSRWLRWWRSQNYLFGKSRAGCSFIK